MKKVKVSDMKNKKPYECRISISFYDDERPDIHVGVIVTDTELISRKLFVDADTLLSAAYVKMRDVIDNPELY